MSKKETDKVLKRQEINKELKKQEEREALQKIEDLKNINTRELNPYKRYSLLKRELRYILLDKSESGYNARYYYVPLSAMQKVITELEDKYDLTSVYTEVYNAETKRHEAIRALYNTRPEGTYTVIKMLETRIDITNLKEIKDPFKLEEEVLSVLNIESLPKDTINSIWLGFLDPKEVGALSTYMQRYTYNQLYDFQETTEDQIEISASQKERVLAARKAVEEREGKKPGKKEPGKEKPKKTPPKESTEKKPEKTEVTETEEEPGTEDPKTQKEKRLEDKTVELRAAIKKDFKKDLVIAELKTIGKSMNDMTENELLELIQILSNKQIKEENK